MSILGSAQACGHSLLCVVLVALQSSAMAATLPLPDPLQLADVTDIALRNRAEVSGANARAEALAQRPAIVGALEDPMVSPSVDHYPFDMMEEEGSGRRYDWSVTVEQRFPLSGVRGYRRAAAHADAQRAGALASGTELDVALEAQRSFFMLDERRRMQHVLDEQLRLAEQLVSVSSSRYASGTGLQADVLRAEVEVARVRSARQSLAAQIRAAEAMLNASLGRSVLDPVPELQHAARLDEPPAVPTTLDRALRSRPELIAGAAEVDRASAEIEVMRAMYKPMATVRIGRASTMAEGPGAMLMIGVSVPIWRERLRAGVAEARAMERMANSDLEGMRRMVEGEAMAARESVSAARIQVLVLESEVLPRALAASDAALAGYASGQGTLVSVIESARALWEVQAEQVMADSALGEAWAKFERSIGGAQQARP
jgi:cobalt-zinc-cadmium efflux system outer membrane protein